MVASRSPLAAMGPKSGRVGPRKALRIEARRSCQSPVPGKGCRNYSWAALKRTFELSQKRTSELGCYTHTSQSWQVRVPVALAACGRFPAYLRIALQDFVDYSSERLLRWRDGSICCAVSRRYRNAIRLSRKTLSAFCCVRGRGRSTSRREGGGARQGAESRAVVTRTCAVAQGHAHPIISTS